MAQRDREKESKARRGRGDGSVRRKEGRRRPWAAEVDLPRVDGGPRRRRVLGHYATKQEAQRRLREELAKRDKGLPVAEPGRLTVKDLSERFFAAKARSVAPTTLEMMRSALRYNVLPFLGEVPLSRLAPVHVSDWLAALDADIAERIQRAAARGRRSPARLRARRDAFDVLSRMLSYGVRLGVLGANPCQRVDRPKAPAPKIRSLSAEESKRLLRVARETEPVWVWSAVALGLCGLRRGETFGLGWGDVDLEGARVRIRQSLQAPDKGGRILGPPKSKAARREIGLPSWALAALRAHRKALGAVPLPGVLVFSTATGEPVHFSNFTRRHFRPLAQRAGVGWATFHALRHTFATLLLGGGVDIKAAQVALGHAKASHTLDIYADAMPVNVERATAVVDALIREAEDTHPSR